MQINSVGKDHNQTNIMGRRKGKQVILNTNSSARAFLRCIKDKLLSIDILLVTLLNLQSKYVKKEGQIHHKNRNISYSN